MAYSGEIEKIFSKYKSNIYHLALSIVRNEKDAEDVLQNTLIKIIKNLDTFRNQSKISTWIYKVTYNEALMYLRKRRRQSRLSDYLKEPRGKSSSGLFVNWAKLPDQQLLDEEFKARMESAINSIPIKYRMAVLLHHTESLPLRESARVMGLKLNSLKTRLHRAYLIIKSSLEDYFKDKKEPGYLQDKRCGLWINFMRRYLDGRLGGKGQNSFKSHINDCPACKIFLKQYARAIRITSALQCQDVPFELQEKIRSFILKTNKKYARR